MSPDVMPFMIPIVGSIAGCAMVVFIVAIVYWNKTRAKELELHREMRLREMEHERSMKQMEIEIEKAKAGQGTSRVV